MLPVNSFADGTFPLNKKLSPVGGLLYIQTNCTLSKFILEFHYRKFERVTKTDSLARLVRKLSREILAEDSTWSMTAGEKTQTRIAFAIDSKHHTIVAANIMLFLERHRYIGILDGEIYQGKTLEWNQLVV